MNTILAFRRFPHACALVLAAILAAPAGAGEPALLDASQIAPPAIEGTDQAVRTVQAAAADTGTTVSIGGATVRAVDLGKLARERGRADTVVNDTKINGEVASNSAVNVQTGSNTIDAGSFANMSGIPVVIQNSGANVLIQNATVINLQFQ